MYRCALVAQLPTASKRRRMTVRRTFSSCSDPEFPSSLSIQFAFPAYQPQTRLNGAMLVSTDGLVAMLASNFSTYIIVFLLPLISYYFVKWTMAQDETRAKTPPSASHWFPLLSHTRTFMLGSVTLASTFLYV
jgi:hypothetical protein